MDSVKKQTRRKIKELLEDNKILCRQVKDLNSQVETWKQQYDELDGKYRAIQKIIGEGNNEGKTE